MKQSAVDVAGPPLHEPTALNEVPEASLSEYNVEHFNNPEHSDAEDEFAESEILLPEDLGYDEEVEEEMADYEDIQFEEYEDEHTKDAQEYMSLGKSKTQ